MVKERKMYVHYCIFNIQSFKNANIYPSSDPDTLIVRTMKNEDIYTNKCIIIIYVRTRGLTNCRHHDLSRVTDFIPGGGIFEKIINIFTHVG